MLTSIEVYSAETDATYKFAYPEHVEPCDALFSEYEAGYLIQLYSVSGEGRFPAADKLTRLPAGLYTELKVCSKSQSGIVHDLLVAGPYSGYSVVKSLKSELVPEWRDSHPWIMPVSWFERHAQSELTQQPKKVAEIIALDDELSTEEAKSVVSRVTVEDEELQLKALLDSELVSALAGETEYETATPAILEEIAASYSNEAVKAEDQVPTLNSKPISQVVEIDFEKPVIVLTP
ncbi:hypothetical protein [Thaumasiovibrio sp. DFM-14]|uniref:hypothetical protein n=1 Tax=Thaumasiovibrio sp. DFM-14 TaxID=3384792 RepID=UPI0039A0764D